MKMIPVPLRVPGTSPKTEFEAFDALASKLIRTPKPELPVKREITTKKKRVKSKR